MRDVNYLRILATAITTSFMLFAAIVPTMLLFADPPPLPYCNGKMMSDVFYDCLPLDMTGCALKTQAQCPAIPCGGDGMNAHFEVVNQLGSCIPNNTPDGSIPGEGWTTRCATVTDTLTCYYEYACTWDADIMECTPYKKICCRSITVDSYDSPYECKVGYGGPPLADISPRRIQSPQRPRIVIATATSDSDEQGADWPPFSLRSH